MRYNDFTMLPERAFQPLGGKMTLEGGGSPAPAPQQQAAPTSTSVTQTTIPEYAKPYMETLLGKTQAVTDTSQNPYQQYGGQRVADFSPLQQQAFQSVGNMQTAPQLGQATNLAGAAGIGSLMAGQNYQTQAQDPNAMASYMSPYMQNAVDVQKNQAVLDYQRQQPAMNAAATNAGAFGGSRQAIVQGMGNEGLQRQLAQIQGTGTQQAYQNAQNAMQFGTTAGLQGYGQAQQGASTLGTLGQNQYTQGLGIAAAQQQAGAQQQAQQQAGLSQQYQDFLNQQNYPYKQLGFMSDILRGMPLTGGQTQTMYQAPPSTLSQTAGMIGGLGSLGAALLNK